VVGTNVLTGGTPTLVDVLCFGNTLAVACGVVPPALLANLLKLKMVWPLQTVAVVVIYCKLVRG